MLVIETVNAATFEGIVILLGSHGFALAERQVSSGSVVSAALS